MHMVVLNERYHRKQEYIEIYNQRIDHTAIVDSFIGVINLMSRYFTINGSL